jgi:hypothetical protein
MGYTSFIVFGEQRILLSMETAFTAESRERR